MLPKFNSMFMCQKNETVVSVIVGELVAARDETSLNIRHYGFCYENVSSSHVGYKNGRFWLSAERHICVEDTARFYQYVKTLEGIPESFYQPYEQEQLQNYPPDTTSNPEHVIIPPGGQYEGYFNSGKSDMHTSLYNASRKVDYYFPKTDMADAVCTHDWVNTGMIRTWCKKCDCNGEYVNGHAMERLGK